MSFFRAKREASPTGRARAPAISWQVAVGRALMTKPSELMLDEPTAGVPPIVMDELLDRIIEVKKTGIAILMVEQNARQALAIADRDFVMTTRIALLILVKCSSPMRRFVSPFLVDSDGFSERNCSALKNYVFIPPWFMGSTIPSVPLG